MKEIVWVLDDVVLAIHDEQLATHGGLSGVRDRGLVDSALARPRNRQPIKPVMILPDLQLPTHMGLREIMASQTVTNVPHWLRLIFS